MIEFTINKFLDLRLEDGRTNVYVNNELFLHCKYILINIPVDKIRNFKNIHSIDDAVVNYNKFCKFPESRVIKISPETRFWVHCSNLQTWYENNYNPSLIHSNLAFPLLRQLAKVGDRLALTVFNEELLKRFESGNIKTIQFLIYNRYLDFLNNEELDCLFEIFKSSIFTLIFNQLSELMTLNLTNYREIKEIIDIFLFFDLKFNRNLIIRILDKLDMKNRVKFARFLIYHLNYKEFINYKISYGKYFNYFEKIIRYMNENCPKIIELLKIIDSGFMNGSIPLDEKKSYGFVSYLGSS